MTKQIELTAEQKSMVIDYCHSEYFPKNVGEACMIRGIEIGRAEAQGETVAWMHDGEGRVDVAHDAVKKVWHAVDPKYVEHYTIPLGRVGQRPAPMSTDEVLKLWRDCEHASTDGYALKFARAIEYRAGRKPQPQGEADLLQWAVAQWQDQVANRPLINVYRRTIDHIWREVIRHCGGDDLALLGPLHDDLVAANPQQPQDDVDRCLEWLRNNYQDHANIADLCDAMRAALAPQQPQGEAWRKRRLISMPKIDEPSLRVVGFVVGKNEFDPLGLPASIIESIIAAPKQPEPSAPDDAKVICPACCHQFRAIPPQVQRLMIDAGFEPPYTTKPEPSDALKELISKSMHLAFGLGQKYWQQADSEFISHQDKSCLTEQKFRSLVQETIHAALEAKRGAK